MLGHKWGKRVSEKKEAQVKEHPKAKAAPASKEKSVKTKKGGK